jgi:hypothetical protein
MHIVPGRGVTHVAWKGGAGTRRIEPSGEPLFTHSTFLECFMADVFAVRTRLAFHDVLRDPGTRVLAVRRFAFSPFGPIVTESGEYRAETGTAGPRLWQYSCLSVSDADGEIIAGGREHAALTVVRLVPNIEPLFAMSWFALARLKTDTTPS